MSLMFSIPMQEANFMNSVYFILDRISIASRKLLYTNCVFFIFSIAYLSFFSSVYTSRW